MSAISGNIESIYQKVRKFCPSINVSLGKTDVGLVIVDCYLGVILNYLSITFFGKTFKESKNVTSLHYNIL